MATITAARRARFMPVPRQDTLKGVGLAWKLSPREESLSPHSSGPKTMTDLAPGDRAPSFSLPASGGGVADLAALKGKKVVLYFYPKDDTPGCTQEAVDFTAKIDVFHAAGAEVIGVSKDTVQKHDKFVSKHGLAVTLASDEAGDVLSSYGVWGEKQLYGRTFLGIERSTFLINAEGRIARVWRKVKVKGHVDEVLAAAQAL
jgi:peroxiredoxin Q/BCP